jgi:methylglutaconyl-CoA hydratase
MSSKPSAPETVELQVIDAVATLTLARPEIHNAFDDALIGALSQHIDALAAHTDIRVVVLTGAGASFSAGADLNWMRRMAQADESANRRDAQALAHLMRSLYFLPQTTIARVNGAAFGGGVGLIACCDITIGVDTAKFGLTETRLGLVPAVISPYVMDALGARQARRLFQTAEIFDAPAALAMGLLHQTVSADALDEAVERQIDFVLKAGPQAVREAKALVHRVNGASPEHCAKLDDENAALIARLRVSPEGQEGLSAFLDKRKPSWI